MIFGLRLFLTTAPSDLIHDSLFKTSEFLLRSLNLKKLIRHGWNSDYFFTGHVGSFLGVLSWARSPDIHEPLKITWPIFDNRTRILQKTRHEQSVKLIQESSNTYIPNEKDSKIYTDGFQRAFRAFVKNGSQITIIYCLITKWSESDIMCNSTTL